MESGVQYPFIIMNTDRSDKKVHIGGISLIYILKKKSFYLIVSVLKVLFKEFILQDDQKVFNKILHGIQF